MEKGCIMTTTVNGTFVTYNDGTNQLSANFKSSINAATAALETSYSIGSYMWVDTQFAGSPTNPIPLDGWTSSGYANPGVWNAAYGSSYSVIGYNQGGGVVPTASPSNTYGVMAGVKWDSGTVSGFSQWSGTWKSRGSNGSMALIVRVA
jgi:hypothetical protein